MAKGDNGDWPFLFSDFTLAEFIAERVAEGSGGQVMLDVPVLDPAGPRIVERSLTQPFIDRFDDEVPGGGLMCKVAYDFTGDERLFHASPGGVPLKRILARVTPGAVVINHLRSDADEAAMARTIAQTAADIDAQLTILRAEANAEFAARVEAVTTKR